MNEINERKLNQKLFKEDFNFETLGDLREWLNITGKDVHTVLKTPHELLTERLGDDYIIQPTFSDKHFTEYVVIDRGVVLSFQITNNDYDVFSVSTFETFFANKYTVSYWLDFLKDCEQIREIICDLTYYE